MPTLDETLLAQVARRTDKAIILTDLQRRITWVNPSFERTTGYALQDALGRSPGELLQFPGTDAAEVARLRAALQAGSPCICELLNRGRDGRVFWVELEVQPLLDASGWLTGFVGLQTDITARKQSEASLRASSSFLDNTGRIAGVGGWEYDVQHCVAHWSPQACRLLDLEPDGHTGMRRVLRLCEPAGRRQLVQAARRGFAGDVAWDLELPFVTMAGRHVWLRVAAEGVFADGGLVRVAGAVQDVSARRAMQAEVLRGAAAAEQASRAKTDFIATISHELRTPLQSILGFSDLGRVFAAAQPQLAQMFDDVHAGGQRMLRLVDTLLDVSKIDGTAGSLALQRHDLSALAVEVVHELRPLAARAGLQVAGPARTPLWADVDAYRIQQVLRNVLANAFRHAPPGTEVLVQAIDDGAHGVALQVRDHGPGIPPCELESIFDAFVQSSRTRDGSGGTGLGLTICRRIMGAHGGSITAANADGGGALFHIRLPASVRGPVTSTRPSAAAAEPA